MNIELEAKLKIESHASVRAALSECGAEHLGRWREFNTLYDTTDQALRARMGVLRLRRFTSEIGPPRSAVLTFKGPTAPGRFKRREEIETEVGDADAMHAVLVRLDYAVFASFEKRRESWHWQDCRIELDTLPLLGTYIEIEGPDEAAITACQQGIGLSHLNHEPSSYLGMLGERCRAAGQPLIDLRLPADLDAPAHP